MDLGLRPGASVSAVQEACTPTHQTRSRAPRPPPDRFDLEAPLYPTASQEGGAQLPGGSLCQVAGPLLLFLFRLLFARTACPVAFLRVKVRPTSVRRQ